MADLAEALGLTQALVGELVRRGADRARGAVRENTRHEEIGGNQEHEAGLNTGDLGSAAEATSFLRHKSTTAILMLVTRGRLTPVARRGRTILLWCERRELFTAIRARDQQDYLRQPQGEGDG